MKPEVAVIFTIGIGEMHEVWRIFQPKFVALQTKTLNSFFNVHNTSVMKGELGGKGDKSSRQPGYLANVNSLQTRTELRKYKVNVMQKEFATG